MLPKIRAVITADTSDAEAGFDRVNKSMRETERSADRAGRSVGRMGSGIQRTGGRVSGAFTRNIQNAAFQMGDFATQVGAGTSASVALGQQLPQLLGGFGVLGAVLGAVAAIAVPLTRAFSEMSASGTDLTQVLGVLSPMAGQLADGFREVARVGVVMAEAIINNLDRILITAGLVAGFFVGKWVAAFVAARIATLSLAAALTTLRTALIRTGIGAIVIALGEAVFQFTRLSQAVGGTGEAAALVGAVFQEVFERIKTSVSLLGEIFGGVGLIIEGAFTSAFGVVQEKFTGLINTIIRGLNVVRAAGGAQPLDEFDGGNASDDGQRLMASGAAIIASAGGQMARDLSAPLQSVEKLRELLASIKEDRITIPDLLGVGTDAAGEGGKSLEDKLSEQQQAVADHVAQIRALTQGGLNDQLGAWGDYFGNLAQLTGTNNRKLLGLQKSFAAATALVNAYQAYTEVLKDPTLPWWGRIAAAGKVLAAGIGAVNAIRSTSEGGGGGAVGAVAGATGQAIAAPLDVRLSGVTADTLLTGADLGNLLDNLNDEAGDRGFRLMIAR